MTSIFENTHSKVTVHILHDETLTDDNRRKLLRTAEKYSQSLKFYDVGSRKEALNSDRLSYARGRYSLGSLFRLLVPDVLTRLDKVIYLDCDVIFDMDIHELWSIDMENKTLAGAIDLPGRNFNDNIFAEKMRLLLNGCRPESYINAGILLMDLNRIRERGSLLFMAGDWLARRGEMALAADQDALNSIFAGDIKIIDSKFNQNVLIQNMSGRIIHMIFGKPWKKLRGCYSDRLYWKMFLRSAWGENVTRDEFVDILNDVIADSAPKAPPAPNPNILLRIAWLLKRIVIYVNSKTIDLIIPFRALHYIRLDIKNRIKSLLHH